MNLYYFGSEKKALLRSERLRQKRRLKEEACLGNLPERVGKAGGGSCVPGIELLAGLQEPHHSTHAASSADPRSPELPRCCAPADVCCGRPATVRVPSYPGLRRRASPLAAKAGGLSGGPGAGSALPPFALQVPGPWQGPERLPFHP